MNTFEEWQKFILYCFDFVLRVGNGSYSDKVISMAISEELTMTKGDLNEDDFQRKLWFHIHSNLFDFHIRAEIIRRDQADVYGKMMTELSKFEDNKLSEESPYEVLIHEGSLSDNWGNLLNHLTNIDNPKTLKLKKILKI